MPSLFQDEETSNAHANAENVSCKSILVPYPVDKAYDYGVPADMPLSPGEYVAVPLGSREVPAVCWGEGGVEAIDPKKLKNVLMRYDLPPMPEEHRRFIDWVAHYTMAAKGAVLKLSLSVPGALEPPAPAKGYVLNPDFFTPHLNPPPSEGGRKALRRRDRRGDDWADILDKSRQLRTNMTEAEKKLWYHLRKENLGGKFRRQYQIPPYIVDFVCLEKRLIVELDGGQHDKNQEYDRQRTEELEALGYKVIRFWNNEVNENLGHVLEKISDFLEILPTLILPPLKGGVKPQAEGGRKLTDKRKSVIEVLSQASAPLRAAEIADLAGCTPGVVAGMAKKNLLEQVDVFTNAPCRNPNSNRPGFDLSPEQADAAAQLKNAVLSNAFSVSLLDGVTGAGKTEVYFEAVAEALKQDKQVLILLPEIALSNTFLERFKTRFGCAPALWHSSLSSGQRKNTWRGVAKGETKVVIGARSALFLPYQDLGLIVVDEEHDPAYKQEDGVIYHARDMAVVRAHMGFFPIVLVSATPSLETMHNVWEGKYHHVQLSARHGGAAMPDIHLIDLKTDTPERQHFISPTLHKAIEETLERGEQALLFLNRRGYAPLTLCRTCGHRFECPRCTAWMVEHRRTGRLHCHHCDHYMQIPKTCPSCGDADSLVPCGPGVERIAEEVKALFPDKRSIILSSDTADTRDKLVEVLQQIQDGQVDIIIGTQIIAKGHHFPKLTCVGVVDADLGLAGGDLRATERTYQLLHQVSGRAGRAELKGRVYLQSFNPESRVMQALKSGDRDMFLQVEEQERQAANMPPFSRLAGIIVSGRDEGLVLQTAKQLGLCAPQGAGLRTLGPAEAPIYKLRGKYRRRLLVRADKKIDIQKTIAHWLAQVKTPSTVRVQVDIDPQSFL